MSGLDGTIRRAAGLSVGDEQRAEGRHEAPPRAGQAARGPAFGRRGWEIQTTFGGEGGGEGGRRVTS